MIGFFKKKIAPLHHLLFAFSRNYSTFANPKKNSE